MQQNEILQLQRVFKSKIAGQLLVEGFKLYDTHPNKNNSDVTVFRFYKTEDLLNRLEELKTINSKYTVAN